MNPDEPTPATPEDTADQKQKPKKRRWSRRIFWTLLILGIIAFLINGLAVRKTAQYFINQSLEEQGMTGSLEVTGSISSGFEINNLHYTGVQGIQSLDIDHMRLDYQLADLPDLKVDLLQAKNVNAVIDLAKFKPSEDDSEPTDWKQTLKELRPIIMNPEIDLENLDITILDQGKKLLHWKLGALKHQANSDEIKLEQWLISDANNLSPPEQSASLVWTDGKLTSQQLKVLPELTLGKINFEWEPELKGKAILIYRDATIEANIDENTTLKLSKGNIHSADILKTLSTFGIKIDPLDADLVLNKLDLNIPTKQIESPIPDWNIASTIGIKSAHYEAYNIQNTTIQFQQQTANYHININGTAIQAPLNLDIKGSWQDSKSEIWWESTNAELSFQTQLNDQILALIPDLEQLPNELKINQTKISGQLSTQITHSQPNNTNAKIELSKMMIKNAPIPTLGISAHLNNNKLNFNLRTKASPAIIIDGEIDTNILSYKASLLADTKINKSPWMNAFAEIYESPVLLSNKLDLQWNGSGNITSNTHQGSITSKDLILKQPENAPVKINLTADYDWPNSLNIENISIEQQELFANCSFTWDGQQIIIQDSEIQRHGEAIANITGKIPFNTDIDDSTKFFAQPTPWEIIIDTDELKLSRMAEILQTTTELKPTGTLQTTLQISGSPLEPQINGNLNLKSLNDIFELGLNDIDLSTNLSTRNNKLLIDGNILEAGTELVTLDLQLPFTPHQWLQDDNLLETFEKNSQINGSAEIKRLPLNRLTTFVPELEKIEGMLDLSAKFTGTIAEPKYKIEYLAELPIISLKDAGVDDITNVKITGLIDQSMILNSDLVAKINGGNFSVSAVVDVNDPEAPIFNVNLLTNHALVYRDDVFAMRANAKINLAGTIEQATISGDLGIVESLFYKDIDLIPIGIPSSVETVSLPSIDTEVNETLPIPPPFDQWKLNLKINTIDPILIRGNIGSGRVKGTIKVNGNLAKPSLDGTLLAQKIKAKLPFSILDINNGKIIFKPNKGFIPELDIRGKSQVGVHRVILNAYGSADDPKLTLSSYPALPENEIMTLLATGTTNSGLEDRDVATFKTLQLLLLELKQRSDRPGGNKLFSKVLGGIDNLDLKVGETNQLTGDKYASATAKLHRRWFLTAQIDNNQPPQTRGLLIFALRFR